MTRSILAAALERGKIEEAPYFHLVVEDALPRDLADALVAGMPPLEVFTGPGRPGNNQRFALPTPRAVADPRASREWKQAVAAINEDPQDLLDWITRNLGARIRAAYPDFEDRYGPLEGLEAVPRARGGRQRHQIGIDAQVVANSPAIRDGTRVRGPHLDLPDKLFSGLLYLRRPEDDSTGAELELFEARSDDPTFEPGNDIPAEAVRHVRTYPYRHNLLVFPLNTPRAIHGVSPRRRTVHPRYHVHIVGEMAAPLFSIRTRPLGWRDYARKVRRKLTGG